MKKSYRLLALVPPAGMIVAPLFANRVEPYVFGLPFLLAWIVGCVLATSAVMGLILALDRRAARDHRGAAEDPIP
jgi:hypothetical protein